MSFNAQIVKRLAATRNSPSFTLDVDLHAGSNITALVGPSGAGKSLALNCIGGFVTPDKGKIVLGDRVVFDAEAGTCVPPRHRHCGYMFQDHALFPHMTVRENLQFAARLAGAKGNRRAPSTGLHQRRRVNELLESFEIGEFADRRTAQLSGGQKQRAALARILVSEPRLLLLDEPSRGLDMRLRENFYRVLTETRERLNAPVLLVTHEMEECFRLADEIVVFEAGRIVAAGAKEMLLHRPQSLSEAKALGVFNVIPAEITALNPAQDYSRLRALEQSIEGPYFPGHLLGDRGYLCVRYSESHAVPAASEAGLTLRVMRIEETSLGRVVHFESDVKASMPRSMADKGARPQDMTVQFNRAAMQFLV